MASPAGQLASAGVLEQAAAVRDGRITAIDLVEAVLDRIAAAQPGLNPFRAVLAGAAREQAARVDTEPDLGTAPLAGVPVAIKDNAAVAGERALMGTGSPQPVAAVDDELVRRLRAAGAVPVGLTHLPELALWAATESRWHGITRNPWDPDRAPGGSSGGSSAAVAAGLVAVAHATDGLGSIRIPASACGLVGLKPTHGLLPLTGGDADHWLGMSHAGFLTRSVADTAAVLDAVLLGSTLSGSTQSGSTLSAAAVEPPAQPLRVAVSSRPWIPVRVDPEVRAGLDRTTRLLRELGHRPQRRDPPYGNALSNAASVRYLAGVAQDRAGLADPDAVEPRTRWLAMVGGAVPPSGRRWARQVGAAFGRRMLDVFFTDADVLLTPTVPGLPVRAGELSRRGLPGTLRVMLPYAAFTGPWNACGFPAISIPAATASGGLPVGMQLVAPPGHEARLLSLAGQLESVIGWTARRPEPVGDVELG